MEDSGYNSSNFEDLMLNIHFEENESRELVRKLESHVKEKQDLTEAFDLFLKCGERKFQPSMENFILTLATNTSIELYEMKKATESLRWINQVFVMAKSSNNVEFQQNSLSIMTRIHINLQQWTEAKTCLSNMKPFENKSWENNLLSLQITLHQQRNPKEGEEREGNFEELLNDLYSASKDIIQMKTVVKIVLDSGSEASLQKCLTLMLQIKPQHINLLDTAELYCFAIMIAIKHRLVLATIEYFGDYVNWYRQLCQSERQEISDLHLRIMDYIEHKIEAKLGARPTPEDLKEISQLSAALVMLHDRATFHEESLFRSLNYQIRCKYLTDGYDDAMKYLEKFTRRWSDKESPHLRQIILDLEVGHEFQSSSETNSWSQWLVCLNENPPEDPTKVIKYLQSTYDFVTKSKDVENHIKGTYMNLIVRLCVRSWMTCQDTSLISLFEDNLDAASEQLVQFTDEGVWISQILWNIALKMKSGFNSSRFFSRAAKLLPIDAMDRITCRIAQVGALIKENKRMVKNDDIEEAILDLTNFLEDCKDNDQLKRLISIYRLKILILIDAPEVHGAVADAVGNPDLPTLEMFAATLTKPKHRQLKLTTLRMAITCGIRDDDNAVLRCSYVLIEELINDLNIDGILDLLPEILTFSQSQIHSDEVQILTLLITAKLWNVAVRLGQADPYLEKSKQLKEVVSSLIHLVPKFEKLFDGKIPSGYEAHHKKSCISDTDIAGEDVDND